MFCLTGNPQSLIKAKESLNKSSNFNFKSIKRAVLQNEKSQDCLLADTSKKRSRSVKVSSRNNESLQLNSSSKNLRSFVNYKELSIN